LDNSYDAVIASDPKTDKETLLELVSGAVGELMQRVWADNADGWDPIVMIASETPRPERIALSMEKQADFVRFFVEEIFYKYCNADRGTLREKLSVMRGSARFIYRSKYVNQFKEEDND
jgi:CRISPR type I-D-associated protein Csc3/Cas10d